MIYLDELLYFNANILNLPKFMLHKDGQGFHLILQIFIKEMK